MAKHESYTAYESVAEAEVTDDPTIAEFMRFVLPNATEEQIDKFRHFIMCKLHDGIQIGLGLSSYNPMSAADAFRLGVDEGREILIEELKMFEEGGK
jgi:hypothetical protein